MSKKTRSNSAISPESNNFIRHRYMDTAELVFKNQLKLKVKEEPDNYLSFGSTPSKYSYGHYGNTSIVAKRASVYKTDISKVDEQKIKSKLCVVM